MFYDLATLSKPINIAYVAPSVTTFTNLNPGYRVYQVDRGSVDSTISYMGSVDRAFSVVDHQTYFLDLEKIMEGEEATFELEYSAKSTYKLANLSPTSWDELLSRMQEDDDLFDLFYRAFTKQHLLSGCDEECKMKYICTMKSSLSGHNFCPNEVKVDNYNKWYSKTYNKC